MRSLGRSGMTRVEVSIGLACALVVTCITTMALAQAGGEQAGERNARTIKDATLLAQNHRAMLIYAGDNDGILPAPGLINRLAVAEDAGPAVAGKQIPGMGLEDEPANTTANLYSALICQRYISPEDVISPVERNPNVKVDADYNYDAYNPAEDSYWDTTFAANLSESSNVSYAHQPLTMARREFWRNSMDHHLAQIGNRGPRNGALDPDSQTCGPHGNWAGNITFGDNHTEFFYTITPEKLKGDNLFAADAERDNDSLIAFTKLIEKGKAELQFD